MASPVKDVLLVGLGAVGVIYSLILKRSGKATVTAVARSNYNAVNAHGLHIKSEKYGDHFGWRPDRLFPSVAQALDRPYTYVVVTTKAIPELIRTPALLEPFLSTAYSAQHPQPIYVLMQNGLNVEVDLYQAIKRLPSAQEPRIISTAVWIGSGMLGQTTVQHNSFDRVSLGVYRPSTVTAGNTPEESAILEDFASILSAGGSETTVVPEIQRVKYAKNVWNACLGITAALSRYPLTAVFRPSNLKPDAAQSTVQQPQTHPDQPLSPSQAMTKDIPSASSQIKEYTIPLLYEAMTEIQTLGEVLFPPSDGVPGLDPDLAIKTLTNTSRIHVSPDAKHRASTLVDVENGRPTEVEVILGELVRMGRQCGVSIPRIETFYALLLIIQNQLLRQYHEKKASQ